PGSPGTRARATNRRIGARAQGASPTFPRYSTRVGSLHHQRILGTELGLQRQSLEIRLELQVLQPRSQLRISRQALAWRGLVPERAARPVVLPLAQAIQVTLERTGGRRRCDLHSDLLNGDADRFVPVDRVHQMPAI